MVARDMNGLCWVVQTVRRPSDQSATTARVSIGFGPCLWLRNVVRTEGRDSKNSSTTGSLAGKSSTLLSPHSG